MPLRRRRGEALGCELGLATAPALSRRGEWARLGGFSRGLELAGLGRGRDRAAICERPAGTLGELSPEGGHYPAQAATAAPGGSLPTLPPAAFPPPPPPLS